MKSLITNIFGVAGNLFSVMQYLAPVPTFYRIVKNKSTEDFESLPYITTVLNSSLWTYYGLIKPDYFVCTVNGFGALVEAIYVLLFLVYAPPKKRAKAAILASSLIVGLGGGATLMTFFAFHGQFRTKVVGLLCLTPMVVMYASPLAALETVITTKSVEYMPFWLSFNLFLAGGTWAVYAILVHDYFLGVPNGIGFFFGVLQLIVYFLYRNAKPSDKSLSEGLIEEGSQHEPLVGFPDQSDKRNHK